MEHAPNFDAHGKEFSGVKIHSLIITTPTKPPKLKIKIENSYYYKICSWGLTNLNGSISLVGTMHLITIIHL